MNAVKIISFIVAGILILFGVMFIWAAFGEQFVSGWFITGLVTVVIGFGLIWFASTRKSSVAGSGEEVTLKIDLPANVELDTLKCKSCGGVLKPENIKMVAGAPVVTCPYCGTTYQLTEEPKW